jgi:FixJ family two-component response regulator
MGLRSNFGDRAALLACSVGNKRTRVAVVDDEEPVRKAIERLLRSAGMDVETFASGPEFLDVVCNRQPDCVVLDLHMPEMTGFEVQAKLAESNARLPVIIITGHHTSESHSRALAGGASAYLSKPVSEHVLLDAIAATLAHSDV